MSRLASFFSIIFTIVVVGLVVAFSNEISGTPRVSPIVPTAPTTASSTISIVPSTTKSTTTATSTPKAPAKLPIKIIKAPAPPVPATTTPVTAPIPAPLAPSGNVSLDTAAAELRGALVNILCYAPVGSVLRSISASGVFIDAKGIILTNAHVAQHFLLADRGVSCTIRSGSPAADRYKAALIYISPAWIHANAAVLSQASPIGTGEYDFALLAVTKSATTGALPPVFPFLPLAMLPPAALTPVVIASFGAQFLETSQIQSSLYPTVVFGSIKDVYTFVKDTIDVLALGGSAAAQEGSSGGGVADASGALVGMITTSTIEGTTATRSLSAITASYIRSEYSREMGTSLDSLLSQPAAFSVADFAPQIPVLESILVAQLP